jgi:predicted metal-dependent hydrolase
MDISYKVTYSERKTLSIIVDRDRSIIVRAPIGTSRQEIEKVIAEKKVWLFEKLRHPQKYPQPPLKKEMVTGESLLYMGRNYQLEISQDNLNGVKFNSNFIVSKLQKDKAADLIKAWYIDQAREKLPSRIKFFADNLGVEYKKILVMDLKYSWASCTSKKNLNFNWRIIKAPIHVIDYLIVHELAHLIEQNHSPEFWNIVAVQLPNYDRARLWLKENGNQLEVEFHENVIE